MNSSPDLSTSQRDEKGQSTGQMLRRAFALLSLLSLLGGAIAVWQISVMRQRARLLYNAERPALAVLVAHNHFQRFQTELQLLAEAHDAKRFTARAGELRATFDKDVDRADQALAGLRESSERERQIAGLEAIRTVFSSQMDDLMELARLGDWRAVELRSQSRDPVLSALSESLVQDIDELVAQDKRQQLDAIELAGNRAMLTLLSIWIVIFLITAFLGWRVTRSIGGRLQQLDAAARALGRGEFRQRVNVGGLDEIGRLAAVFNDMSTRVSDLYETLRRSEAQFRSLIENVSDFIVVLQADGTIQYASPSFEREAGQGKSALGRNIVDLAAEEDRSVVEKLLTAVREKGITDVTLPVESEFRIRTSAAGMRMIEVSASNLLHHPAVRGIVVNARDVTERRKLEEQLMRAQRMEAIGTLSGGVAHDFNNILTVILGHTEVLLDALQSSSAQYEHLRSIDDAGRRASALTRQLLAFGRKQVLQPKVFNLNSLIVDLDKMLRRLISEDIELHAVTDPKLGSTKADPGQIEQVVMNLVVNARDAIKGGGRITIETANVVLDEGYIQGHTSARSGPHVMLAVSDTGEGISPENLPHIFEPFFTTKEFGKGTGLGLSTVYGIVKQSGGNVWVYSQVGRGTTFKIYLPRVDEPEPAAVEPPRQRATSSGGETVLLVEDEPALRDLINHALSANGFTVLDAISPMDAIALSRRHTGPVHLLLTDVTMPGMDGPALAKQIQKERPEIKVLYMSGYATNFMMHDGGVAPGTNFLEKPFHPSTLLNKVREVLDSSQRVGTI